MEAKIIRDPGKFEGEPEYVPQYWDMVLDGGADEEEYDEDGENPVAVFKLTEEDKAKWFDFQGCTELRLWESDQGFVFSELR
jgi:hypothetical protein